MNFAYQCDRHTALHQCEDPTHPGMLIASSVCELMFDLCAHPSHSSEDDTGC